MNQIVVRESDKGHFERLDRGKNPIVYSLDGTEKTRLNVVLHESWGDADRARFGIHLVDPVIVPDDHEMTAPPVFKREKNRVIQTATMMRRQLPPEPGPSRYDILLETIERLSARLGVVEDEVKELKANARD